MKISLGLFKEVLEYTFDKKFEQIDNLLVEKDEDTDICERRLKEFVDILFEIRKDLSMHMNYSDKFPMTYAIDQNCDLEYDQDGLYYCFVKESNNVDGYKKVELKNGINMQIICDHNEVFAIKPYKFAHSGFKEVKKTIYTHNYCNELDHFFTRCLNELVHTTKKSFGQSNIMIDIAVETGLRLLVLEFLRKKTHAKKFGSKAYDKDFKEIVNVELSVFKGEEIEF